ncbi:hypothetical protein QV06_03825 [Gallibacterium genomosp. 3]|uniref:Uncharacterized protein n=1 Tax=Gallibacterium genomosp. 3 TaxID=505345 RepID=A0A1A7PTR0_9PAST|nr:hypothetical protein [Gallibacterium genomosp. 3]OBX05116.1 hypothetical protein QV06_03825 [Gallibacterium genomosp. 3]
MDKVDLFNVLSKESKKSFICHLHYKNKFSIGKYKQLIRAYKFFLLNVDKIEGREKIISEFLDVFLHTLFLFVCDNDKEDLYKIEPPINFEYKVNVYNKFREMTECLIRVQRNKLSG